MTCDDCLHKAECMEQRGPCREYKDLRQVREDIERINENFKKAAAGAAAGDKAADPQKSLRRRDMDSRGKATDPVPHGASREVSGGAGPSDWHR